MTTDVPEAAPGHTARQGTPETNLVLADELGTLLGDILDTLSPNDLGRLPEPIWALLDFISANAFTDVPSCRGE